MKCIGYHNPYYSLSGFCEPVFEEDGKYYLQKVLHENVVSFKELSDFPGFETYITFHELQWNVDLNDNPMYVLWLESEVIYGDRKFLSKKFKNEIPILTLPPDLILDIGHFLKDHQLLEIGRNLLKQFFDGLQGEGRKIYQIEKTEQERIPHERLPDQIRQVRIEIDSIVVNPEDLIIAEQ